MSFYNIVWFFMIYAFLGWCLEVCYCTVCTGHFVNRGFLNGPVCPIYGAGMCAILLVLLPVQESLLLLFVGAVVLTSALEWLTGFVLEKMFHTSWWDYSDEAFHLGGYICLKFSLAWGVCAVVAVRILHPMVAGVLQLLPRTVGWVLLPLVVAVFLVDGAVTVAGILKLKRTLWRLTELTQALHAGSEAMAKVLGDGALALDDKMDDWKESIQASVDAAQAEWQAQAHKVENRLLNAFPRMKHNTAQPGLEKLRSWRDKK